MNNYLKFSIFITLSIFEVAYAMNSQKMVVTSPVVSLRTAPEEYVIGKEHDIHKSKNMFGRCYDLFTKLLTAPFRDPVQDSQLLYNERIICLEELPQGWLKVKTIEQYYYNKETKQWDYIPGFIKKDQAMIVEKFKPLNLVVCKLFTSLIRQDKSSLPLSMGTKLRGARDLHDSFNVTLVDGSKGSINAHDVYEMTKEIKEPVETIRKHIVACAQQLVGTPYCWGGMSSFGNIQNGLACSTDCSGLLKLVYRAAGLEIPRNSNDMFLKSKKVSHGNELLPADCIFLAYVDRPERVNHVIIYAGDNQIIENCLTKGACTSDSQARLGKAITTLNYGDKVTVGTDTPVDYLVYFGSFLNDPKLIRELREYATANYDM